MENRTKQQIEMLQANTISDHVNCQILKPATQDGQIDHKECYQKGEYILNHYDKNSRNDKLCLSKNLHKWALDYVKRYNRVVPLEPARPVPKSAQKVEIGNPKNNPLRHLTNKVFNAIAKWWA